MNEAVVPKIAMLKELEEGLHLHGLLAEIRKHPAAIKPVFTASTCFDMTADEFLQRLVVHFSKQQLLKSKEQDLFKYFMDFIQTLYYKGKKIFCLFLNKLQLHAWIKQCMSELGQNYEDI